MDMPMLLLRRVFARARARPPRKPVFFGLGAAATLAAGWVWDGPRQYMVLHGLWHILGAAAIYQVALAVQ